MPCIRDSRIPVSTVLYMLSDRMSDKEVLDAYPDLDAEDIREALRFGAWLASGRPSPAEVG